MSRRLGTSAFDQSIAFDNTTGKDTFTYYHDNLFGTGKFVKTLHRGLEYQTQLELQWSPLIGVPMVFRFEQNGGGFVQNYRKSEQNDCHFLQISKAVTIAMTSHSITKPLRIRTSKSSVLQCIWYSSPHFKFFELPVDVGAKSLEQDKHEMGVCISSPCEVARPRFLWWTDSRSGSGIGSGTGKFKRI